MLPIPARNPNSKAWNAWFEYARRPSYYMPRLIKEYNAKNDIKLQELIALTMTCASWHPNNPLGWPNQTVTVKDNGMVKVGPKQQSGKEKYEFAKTQFAKVYTSYESKYTNYYKEK